LIIIGIEIASNISYSLAKLPFKRQINLHIPVAKNLTKSVLVLGTTSPSGKSTIVAALYRILKNWELKVAPFKSQKTSLNSWVTSEGETRIAQAVQARASVSCGRGGPVVICRSQVLSLRGEF